MLHMNDFQTISEQDTSPAASSSSFHGAKWRKMNTAAWHMLTALSPATCTRGICNSLLQLCCPSNCRACSVPEKSPSTAFPWTQGRTPLPNKLLGPSFLGRKLSPRVISNGKRRCIRYLTGQSQETIFASLHPEIDENFPVARRIFRFVFVI